MVLEVDRLGILHERFRPLLLEDIRLLCHSLRARIVCVGLPALRSQAQLGPQLRDSAASMAQAPGRVRMGPAAPSFLATLRICFGGLGATEVLAGACREVS